MKILFSISLILLFSVVGLTSQMSCKDMGAEDSFPKAMKSLRSDSSLQRRIRHYEVLDLAEAAGAIGGTSGLTVIPMGPLFNSSEISIIGNLIKEFSAQRPTESRAATELDLSWASPKNLQNFKDQLSDHPVLLNKILEMTELAHLKVREALPEADMVLQSAGLSTGSNAPKPHTHDAVSASSVTMSKVEIGRPTVFRDMLPELSFYEPGDAVFFTDQVHNSPPESGDRLSLLFFWVPRADLRDRKTAWD